MASEEIPESMENWSVESKHLSVHEEVGSVFPGPWEARDPIIYPEVNIPLHLKGGSYFQ